jgi:hypothetical protein
VADSGSYVSPVVIFSGITYWSSSLQDELALLHDSSINVRGRSRDHEIRTAPIVTRDAYVAAGYREHATQYGVLGRAVSILCVSRFSRLESSLTGATSRSNKSQAYSPVDPRLYVNTVRSIVCLWNYVSDPTHRMHRSPRSFAVYKALENHTLSRSFWRICSFRTCAPLARCKSPSRGLYFISVKEGLAPDQAKPHGSARRTSQVCKHLE